MKKSYTSSDFEKALSDVKAGVSITAAAKNNNVPRSSLQNFCFGKVVSLRQQHTIDTKLMREKARSLRLAGASYTKICSEVGCCHTSAIKWCKDIILSDDQVKLNLRAKTEKQDIAVQYRLQGMYVPEIARALECSKGSVSLWLKKARVVTPQKISASEKIIKKRDKKERAEKRITNKKSSASCEHIKKQIMELRKNGLGSQEIASIVNSNKSSVLKVIREHNLSAEEKEKIKNLVNRRTQQRRDSGELKPVGGFREGAERSKFGYYKGIYCSSTYELCWVIYQLDHGKEVKRFPGFLESKTPKFKYYPDFLDEEKHIIEIKGYEDKYVSRKTKLAKSLGYKVTLLKKEDLKDMFEYVDQTYSVTKYNRYTLYDDHKPTHSLVCSECQVEFFREKLRKGKKSKTVNYFCSRSCAGKNRERLGAPKLSKEDALAIFQSKESGKTLGLKYKVDRNLVYAIKSKKSYTWIHA